MINVNLVSGKLMFAVYDLWAPHRLRAESIGLRFEWLMNSKLLE
jgi:hypothetical protein